MKNDFRPLLLGKDLRSIARVNALVKEVRDQEAFDDLFKLLLHHERLLVMRAADAVEKVTVRRPEFLLPHKHQLFALLKGAIHKELKWHLALIITRVPLSPEELEDVWTDLNYWLQNANESKIVRVNALQGLFDLSRRYPGMGRRFKEALSQVHHERIPSIQARVRKLEKLGRPEDV